MTCDGKDENFFKSSSSLSDNQAIEEEKTISSSTTNNTPSNTSNTTSNTTFCTHYLLIPCGLTSQHFFNIFDNLYFLAPLVVFLSLLLGMAFYMIANGWDLALSYYYAASVLLGALYLVPNEPNPYSPIFTQWYFLWGTTLIMGAIAAMANDLLYNASRVAADERKRMITRLDSSSSSSYPPPPATTTTLTSLRDQLLEAIGWQDHRNRYIVVMLAILWYLLGILYGVYYEHWDIYHAAFFSLSAMSASGTSPPVCEEEGGAAGGGGGSPSSTCRLGNMRSFLVGTYLLFGVPIFTYTMGQFAEILVERAIRARERELLMRPLSEEEFRFAMELQGGLTRTSTTATDDTTPIGTGGRSSSSRSETPVGGGGGGVGGGGGGEQQEQEQEVRLDLGDFIILELLRLQKISQHDLDYIKDLFRILDADGDGVLIHASVETRKPFTTSSSCSPSSSTPYQPTAATSLESPMDRRTKDLLQCRGQDVIHFLAPIREDYGSTTTTSPVTTPTPAPPGSSSRSRRTSRAASISLPLPPLPPSPRGDDIEAALDRDGEQEEEEEAMSSMRSWKDESSVDGGDEGGGGREEEEEENHLGTISRGYNNLIIPVMRQMSMRPSAKMKTVKRSRTARSTVFTQLAARSKSTSPPPAAATPAAATPSLSTRAAWSRRKSQSAMIIHDENVPLLKHFVSESSMLS
eukprot:scaffold14709_cov268-Ochromonas_danica.AAC.13